MSRRRVLIVQPYVPDYRVQMFSKLSERAREMDIDVLVAAGQPSFRDAARSDAVSGLPWMQDMSDRKFSLGRWEFKRRLVAPTLSSYKPTHVIVEQALHNLDTYEIAVWAKRFSAALGAWGHGATYTQRKSHIHRKAKDLLTRRTSWFFVCTDGGQQYLRNHGYPSSRITVLRNAGDTKELQRDLTSIGPEELANFQHDHGLSSGKTAIFLGGLDSRKALPFLLSAVQRIEGRLPDFKLIIGGDGELASELHRLQQEGAPIRVLGRLEGRLKALALASASIMMVPEWVGLVSVDSLVAGVPIVTTQHWSHAPEFEYLTNGRTCVVTPHTVADYASQAHDLLCDRARLDKMRENAQQDSFGLSAESMARNFAVGMRSWIERTSTQ